MKVAGGALIVVVVLCYAIIFVSASPYKSYVIKEAAKVKFVAVVTRHGDRTPIFSFSPKNLPPVEWDCPLPATIEAVPIEIFDTPNPQFPRLYRKTYKKDIESFNGNCAAGQLTVTGMKQHFALGEKLRKRYSTLFSTVKPEFGSKQVYVESSDLPRTFLSAQSQLLGLFPPKPASKLDTTEIISIETTEITVSDFFPNYKTCPRLSVIRGDILKTKRFLDWDKSITPFKNDLAKRLKFLNGTSQGFPEWTQIYDTFWCRRAHDFPLPPDFTVELVDEIIRVAETEYQFVLNSTDYVKLGIGKFFGRLKSKLSSVASGEDTDLKYALFSGHDTTIAPLISLLGNNDGFWPPYASNVIFELSEENDNYFVRVFYNDKEITIPGCPSQQPCPWKTFDQVTRSLEINEKDYPVLCQV